MGLRGSSRGIIKEKRGVSVVFGAIIVLAILLVASFAYIAAWVPSEGHHLEREHVEEVGDAFLELKSAVDTLELLASRSVDVKMAADPLPIFQGARSGGRLSVEPAGAKFFYAESLKVDNTTSTGYRDKLVLTLTPTKLTDYLIIASAEVSRSGTARANVCLEINGVVYQELENAVKNPGDWYPFNGLKKVRLSGPATIKIRYRSTVAGQAALIRNARLAVWAIACEYAENEAEASTVGTEDRVTLRFTPLRSDNYLLIASATIVNSGLVKLRVNENLFADAQRTSTTSSTYTFGVIKRVSLAGGQEARVVLQYEKGKIKHAHVAAIPLSQLSNHYYAEVEGELSQVVNAYSSQAEEHLLLGTVHLRLHPVQQVGCRFLTDGENSQDPGFVGETSSDWESFFVMDEKALGEGAHVDKLQCWGKASWSAKFGRLISLEVPSLHRLRHGLIRFDANNAYYVDQSWIYELGAVILAQGNASFMVSRFEDVGLVVVDDKDIYGNPLPGDNIRVEVNFIRIKRFDASISSTGTSTILLARENSRYEVENGPRENVVVRVNSTYRNAWAEYLSWLARELNAKGYLAGFDNRALRLTILGKKTSPGENDIYYYERVTEIEVSLT